MTPHPNPSTQSLSPPLTKNQMGKQPFTLVLFLILSSSILTTIAKPSHPQSGSSPSFIRVSCGATQYPSLCYHTLSTYANIIQHSPRKLAATALAVSLSRARSASMFVSKLRNSRGIRHRELEAIKDCIDTMGDTVDQLSRSIKELGHTGTPKGQDFMWHMSNVQTWVSAALTNEDTCVDGFSAHFMDAHIKGAIRMRINNVAQLTSNALALVNRFASRHKTVYDVIKT